MTDPVEDAVKAAVETIVEWCGSWHNPEAQQRQRAVAEQAIRAVAAAAREATLREVAGDDLPLTRNGDLDMEPTRLRRIRISERVKNMAKREATDGRD